MVAETKAAISPLPYVAKSKYSHFKNNVLAKILVYTCCRSWCFIAIFWIGSRSGGTGRKHASNCKRVETGGGQ